MPEAAIDEHSDSSAREDEVRLGALNADGASPTAHSGGP
jgi:hypothetical protein